MKANYYFHAELTSNEKFEKSHLDKLKNNIDSLEEFSNFYSIFSEVAEINFGGYLEIYIDDIPFDLDQSLVIEKMIENIDSIVPGGWSKDSKIEFYSEKPLSNSIWYKEDNEWKFYLTNSPEDLEYFQEIPWEEEGENYDEGFSNYEYDDENW